MVAADRTAADELLRSTRAAVAPGTALRDGLERILRGRTGALIVLGYDRSVEHLCTGGFTVDVEFSSTRLREIAKMDGAIVLDRDISRIHRAAVQMVPDLNIPTEESGTRHRTAERVAKQTGFPVVSVSKSMNMVALYVQGRRYVVEDSAAILSRANQALATLERYKMRLDEVSGTLSALEVEDLVTLRDVSLVAQRLEMVRRIASEIEDYVVELGVDGRLLSLQLEELVAGVEAERELIARDYLPRNPTGRGPHTLEEVLVALEALSGAELIDPVAVARCLGSPSPEHIDGSISPRGYRLLAKIPRVPRAVIDRLVDHFDGLQKLLTAGIEDLQLVDGVGESRARTVRDGLSRMAESSLLERYA